MFSISYPADQHYRSTAFENGVQVFTTPQKLVNLYAFTTSAAQVYLLVSDDAAGPHAPSATYPAIIYPIAAGGGYVAIGTHGGDQFKNGLYVGVYSTAALAAAAAAPDGGGVCWLKVDWTRGYLPNPAAVPAAGGVGAPPFTNAGGQAA
jgi:hypothetical protein